MRKPYLAWWYPGFENPDTSNPIEFVGLCTVDNEINIKFRRLPAGYDSMIRLVNDFREINTPGRLHARDDADAYYMVIRGGWNKINMDAIAKQLDLLATIDPSMDSNWFKSNIARQKAEAGLKIDDPAEYDMFLHGNNNPNLKHITCSKNGGTIQLTDKADTSIATKLLGLGDKGVHFTADTKNPLAIRFEWDKPLMPEGYMRPEYLCISKICAIINPILDVSAAIRSMNEQSRH